MEQAANTAEAAAVDHYFSLSSEKTEKSLFQSGKETDDCFVMRRLSSVGGAIQMTQLLLLLLLLCIIGLLLPYCCCAESDLLKMIAAALTDFPELNCYAALQLLLEVVSR